MARTISDEDIRLNIIVNGNPAQKQLLDLEKSTRKLTKETDALRVEKRKLEAQGKKNSAEWKALSATIKTNTATIDNNKATMKQLQSQIGITGLTMNQLKQRASVLRLALNNMVPGSADSIRYNNELGKISARLTELKLKGRQTKLSLGGIANGFNKYAALGASAIAATTGVVLGMQKMIDYNGKLSDAQSDVQKTTGLTKKEVDELTKSFGILNTRTSRMDLLKIAEEGGRIGIAKEEIADFVRVMNKANVALGDSFEGGPEEVASKLGKLKLLFKETKDIGVDKAYESIGSAINELGANGVATETNIADFATRIGSLSDDLKPTIQDALGLGAAFEESGVMAEISGRAYSIFLGQAAKESSKFAKVMGITTEEVENMINTNPTEFFLQFSQILSETSKGGTDTAKTMADLGLSADGVKKIVGAAGNNFERFRELLELSNTSMINASSLTNEYNIKNNNLAANIEKIQKRMLALFSSEFIVNGLASFVNWFAKLLGVTEDVDGTVTKWKLNVINLIKIIAIAAAGLFSYNAALKLVTLYQTGLTQSTFLLNVAQKANALTGGLLKSVSLLLQYAYFSLTLQTQKATIAQNALNLSTKLNPFGIVIALITAITAAYFLYNKEVDKATKQQNILNDLKLTAKKATQDEIQNLKSLIIIAKDESQTKENRLKAIKKINEISPEYLNNISLETINTKEAKKAIDDYVLSLEKKSMQEAFASKRTEANKKLLDATFDKEKSRYGGFFQGKETDFKAFYEKEEANLEEFKQLTKGWNTYKFDAYRDYKEGIQAAKDELVFLQEEEKKFIKDNASMYVDDSSTSAGTVTNKTTSSSTAGDTEMTAEDKKIADSKIKLAEFIDQWNADQELKKILREEGEEAAEIEKKALEFDKLILDAENDTLLKTQLEDIKEAEIQAIKDKWAETRLQKKQEEDKKYAALNEAQKQRLIKAEEELQMAKINARNQGLNAIQSIFGRESVISKLAFGIQKALAVQEILINTKKANAQITANLAIANMKSIAAFPLTGGMPMVGYNSVMATKSTLTNNINAGAQIAGILASSIQGFEGGLYNKESFAVQRSQDGKMFNAQFGGQTSSGMVAKPTVYMAGENGPELIVDSQAFKQINPDIKNSFMREIGRVKGFEAGLYKPQTFTDVSQNNTDTSSGDNNTNILLTEAIQVIRENKELMQTLKDKGIIAYMSNDLKNGKRIKEVIDDYEALRNKNKI